MSELYDEGIIGLGPDDERMTTGKPFDESPVDIKKREGRSRAPRHPKSMLVTPEPSPTATGGGSHFSGESNSRSSSINSRSSAASRRSQRDRPWRSDKNPQQSSSSLTSSNNSAPPQQINRVDSSDSFDSMGRMVKSKKEDLDDISAVSNSSTHGPPKAAFHVHERAMESAHHCPSEPPPMSMAPPNPSSLPPAPTGPPPPPPTENEEAQSSPLFTNSRWSQYESNPDELQREADIASATAVASAAERAAYRQVKNSSIHDNTGESVMVLSMGEKDGASEESSEDNEELSLMTEDYNADRSEMQPTPKKHASRWDDYDDPTGRVPMEKRLFRDGSGPPSPRQDASERPVLGSLGRSFRNGRDMIMSAVLGTPQDDFEDEVEFRRRTKKSNNHDRVRAEALKMLELAEDATGGADASNPSAIGNGTGALRKTKSGGWTSAEDNDEGMGMSRPATDKNGKRIPSALQGMDMGNNKERSDPYNEARSRLYSDDDEEDGVGVVKTSIGGFGGVRAMDHGDDASLLEEDYLNGQEGERNGKSWSQRYSLGHHLRAMTGGKMASSTDILHAMDEQHRPNKSATNMYKSSAHNMDGDGGRQDLRIHSGVYASPYGKPLFMDVDLAERSSFPPPPHHSTVKRSPVTEYEEKTKRRRVCLFILVLAAIACIFAAIMGKVGSMGRSDSGANDYATLGAAPGSRFSFYATSNVPFTEESGKKLAKELADVPADSFLVHLGDVGLAYETFCDEDVYSEASTILEGSAAPVFVLPGNNDWNDCPDPDVAWNYWDTYLGEFERHFSQSFDVGRQLGRKENFVFLHEGVLFIGVNLVNGRVHDRSEWNKRHAQNVLWTEQNLQLYEYNEYRAVVIFGHSAPYDLLTDYFHPVVDDLVRIHKPVLYLHANSDGQAQFREYRPFGARGGDHLLAAEVDAGGDDAAFVKVTVDFGSAPFTFDQETSSN